MVRAGRDYTRSHLPVGQRLSRKWVTIGQSKGGGASIYTARYATAFGGRSLDYRGAVGTGVPADVEKAVLLMGRNMLRLAETTCVMPLVEKLDGEVIGSWFTAPVATLPGFAKTVERYMAMPTSGFDQPFFMGHGLLDTEVPIAITLPYVLQLQLGEPVTFKTCPTDHSGTLAASQPDTIPFVRRLFAD